MSKPARFSRAAAGFNTVISSVPKRPPSPACGLRAASVIRGSDPGGFQGFGKEQRLFHYQANSDE